MDETITLPRETVEAFLEVSSRVLSMSDPTGPENLERVEVAFNNNKRKQLSEAVYQAEKAIYEADKEPLTTSQMSANAEKRRRTEDDYSQSKERWIAR